MHDGRDEGELLPRAVGQLSHRLVRAPVERERTAEHGAALAGRTGIESADGRHEREVLVGRELLVERRLLGRVAERTLRLDRVLPQIHPVELHATGVGGLEPRGDAKQRALAGAIRSEQPDDLAARHFERHAVEREALAVSPRELVSAQHQAFSRSDQRATRRDE